VKSILFDIDGTLLRGYGAGTRAMTRAGRAICGAAFDLEGISVGGSLDPIIYYDAALKMGLLDHHTLHDAFHDRYLEELAQELIAAERRAHLLPGTVELLEALEQRDDVAVGLVTGNYSRAVPIKFDAVGLLPSRFIAGGFGEDAPTRPGLVLVALERIRALLGTELHARDVIIVGDTPRDIDCALKNDARCLAVATGGYSVEELRAVGPEESVRVVADLSDPQSLLSWL
jgi:phosphoglycolate phosphatase